MWHDQFVFVQDIAEKAHRACGSLVPVFVLSVYAPSLVNKSADEVSRRLKTLAADEEVMTI
jgi:hypothetical protein